MFVLIPAAFFYKPIIIHTHFALHLIDIDGEPDTAYAYGNERLTVERFTGWTGYHTYDPRGSVSKGVANAVDMISENVSHAVKNKVKDLMEAAVKASVMIVFFASTFSSKMQIDFLKVAWGISSVLHFPLRHSFRCRRGAVAGIQSLLVTDM